MKLIFGTGTGRCGTSSLRKLLSMQPGVSISHEQLYFGWRAAGQVYKNLLKILLDRKGPITGDIAPWHLWHTIYSIEEQDATFVCMKRPRRECIDSWIRINNPHRWYKTDKGWEYERLQMLPPFKGDTLDEALENYWNYYYVTAQAYQIAYPERFRIFPFDVFNTKAGIGKLLDFIGVEQPVPVVGIHESPQ